MVGKYTFRLFDRPSFLEGYSSVLDFSRSFSHFHTDDTEKEADVRSLGSDWWAIGDDIRIVLQEYVERSKQ